MEKGKGNEEVLAWGAGERAGSSTVGAAGDSKLGWQLAAEIAWRLWELAVGKGKRKRCLLA